MLNHWIYLTIVDKRLASDGDQECGYVKDKNVILLMILSILTLSLSAKVLEDRSEVFVSVLPTDFLDAIKIKRHR